MHRELADAREVVTGLGWREVPDYWLRRWGESQPSFCLAGCEFVTPAWVRAACTELRMAAETADAFVDALQMFADPRARRLFWHCHWCGFVSDDHTGLAGPDTPEDRPQLAMFYALVMLSGLPYIKKQHAQRNIPPEVTLDTLGDLELWVRENRKHFGVWGLRQQAWLSTHLTGRIFKLGRLQFEPARYRFPFHAYRSAKTDRVLLLAADGQRFRRDGQFVTADRGSEPEPAFVSELRVDGSVICGTPVCPRYGAAKAQSVTLAAAEWREVLRPGDPTLSVHIPATGPMDHAACAESFARAAEFFPRHFPELHYAAFDCHSWLFDPQLGDRLEATANVVRFQREFYLHPLPQATDEQTIERVFGFAVKRVDLATAPADSSLRRAVLAHLRAGGRWRDGGALFFPPDLPWGRRFYFAQSE